MHESVLGEDFERWIAMSDAYARQIAQLGFDNTIKLSKELVQLSHQLQQMDSGFGVFDSNAKTD